MGSSTETVAFQVYKILKITMNFFNFFDWDQKFEFKFEKYKIFEIFS